MRDKACNRLRDERVRRGWTQVELGTLAGLPQQNISEYETGAVVPTVPTMEKLAQAFEVSVVDVLDWITTPSEGIAA